MGESAGVAFRRATSNDAEAVALLHADSWRRHYRGAYSDAFLDGDADRDRLQVWADRLSIRDERTSTILAEYKSRLIGFVHVIFDEDAEYGSLIDNLHVVHDWKRRGVGTELMSRAAGALEGAPGGLYLWVLEQNSTAQAFYRARSGRCTGRRLAEPPPGTSGGLNGSPVVLRYAWADPTKLIV